MDAQKPGDNGVVVCMACNVSVTAEEAVVGCGVAMCAPCDEDFNRNMARLEALAEASTPPPTPETVGLA